MSPTEVALIKEVMARDPELDRRIGALRDHLLPLDQSARPQELPRDFIERVRAQLAAKICRELCAQLRLFRLQTSHQNQETGALASSQRLWSGLR